MTFRLSRGRDERGGERRRQQRLEDLRGGGIDGTGGSERLGGRRHRADHGGEEAFRLRAELRLLPVRGGTLDEPRRLDECVVRDAGQSSVATAPVHDEAKRRRRLLCGGARVEDPAAELQPVARPFVHRVIAPHRIGVLLAQPLKALRVAVAHLLVGRGGEDEVARRARSLRARARRWRPRSPPPGPSCRAHRDPTRSRPRAPRTTDRRSTRPGRRARCPCARERGGWGRRRSRESAPRDWLVPDPVRRAHTLRRSPRGRREAAQQPASRSPAD